MNISHSTKTRKEIGNRGEKIAAEYLKKEGFSIVERNVRRKIGEIDIVARKNNVFHIVEVKTRLCQEFPKEGDSLYDPVDNLDARKIRQIARVGEWYIAEQSWDGEWQIDGVAVWLRERDLASTLRYLPQIL